MIYESDICLCASEECPRYKECLRGTGLKRNGIYTVSVLGEICNEDSEYQAFIPIEERG